MSLFTLIFGARPTPNTIRRPPEGVTWRVVRPRNTGDDVRAWLARKDRDVATGAGALHARRGRDMIVEYADGDFGVVRKDIFAKLYESLGGCAYRKRTDIELRYFTLPHPVRVETLERVQEAEAGDWIMQGPVGELWPVAAAQAEHKYTPA